MLTMETSSIMTRYLKGRVSEKQAETLTRAHPSSISAFLDRALRDGKRRHDNSEFPRGQGVRVRFPDIRVEPDLADVVEGLEPQELVLWVREALDDLREEHARGVYLYSRPVAPGTDYVIDTITAGHGLTVSPAMWRRNDGRIRAGNVIGRPLYARRLPGEGPEAMELFEVNRAWDVVSLTRATSLHAAAAAVHGAFDDRLDPSILTLREVLKEQLL